VPFCTWEEITASAAAVAAPTPVRRKPASGILAVTVVWPSLQMTVESAD